MIVTITRQTSRLALRIRNTLDGAFTQDYKHLQLVIRPKPLDPCHIGGSPWFLTGCWPLHPTGVDLANPRLPDFAAIAIDAFEVDSEGRVVFLLPKRFYDLPNGRYDGVIRTHHQTPINLKPRMVPVLPWGHLGASVRLDENKRVVPCDTPVVEAKEYEPSCELYHFDIDLGPECAAHMVDQCAVDFTKNFNC